MILLSVSCHVNGGPFRFLPRFYKICLYPLLVLEVIYQNITAGYAFLKDIYIYICKGRHNVDSSLYINMGVSLLLVGLITFGGEQNHIDKQGCIHPGST